MKKILLVFCLGCTSMISAQDTGLKPSFIAVVVSDVDSSIAWYSKVLHLKMRNMTDNEARGFKQVVLTGDQMMIELVQLQRALPRTDVLQNYPQGSSIEGFQKFGITVKNFDAFHQRIEKMGVKFYGQVVKDPVDHRKTFLVQDPDGNLLQFFEE